MYNISLGLSVMFSENDSSFCKKTLQPLEENDMVSLLPPFYLNGLFMISQMA